MPSVKSCYIYAHPIKFNLGLLWRYIVILRITEDNLPDLQWSIHEKQVGCESESGFNHQEIPSAIIAGCGVYNWAANCDLVVTTAIRFGISRGHFKNVGTWPSTSFSIYTILIVPRASLNSTGISIALSAIRYKNYQNASFLACI